MSYEKLKLTIAGLE